MTGGRGKPRTTLALSFWTKVLVGPGCWEWSGKRQKRIDGSEPYGRMRLPLGSGPLSRKEVYAHRVSYELHFGQIPDGLEVCHRCDNRLCVRPDHLFLGTRGDNARDAVAKGRAIRSFTPAQAIELRRRVQSGEPLLSVAAELKIKRSTAYNIKLGRLASVRVLA